VPHVAAGSDLAGKRIADVEIGYGGRVLTRLAKGSAGLESPPTPGTNLCEGDTLVIHIKASQLSSIAAAGSRKGSK
jgi:uncharacterized transporter YbjL